MSKIICDVCGTSYPENANQCPICGCVRSVDAQTVNSMGHSADSRNGSYTHVKGGRFSKANVKKRNQAAGIPQADASSDNSTGKKKNDAGLIIAVCLLALSIIAIVVYIVIRFFMPTDNPVQQDPVIPTETSYVTEQTTVPTTELTIPCESVKLSAVTVEFAKAGGVRLLSVTVLPADTTDELIFTSSDESVAIVNQDGKIEAVGPGEATITVTCGTVIEVCKVRCTFEVETSEPETEAATEATTEPDEEFKLVSEDVTLSYKGETWLCYNGDINVKDIEWSSDDEKIATVTDGKVVAVSTGVTVIRGKYNGVEAKCTIRCASSVGSYEEEEPSSESSDPNQEESESSEPATSEQLYTISHEDVTIAVGESFVLTLKDANGNTVEVTWIVSNDSCEVNGNSVTGKNPGTAKVYVAYEGREYACTVRVK